MNFFQKPASKVIKDKKRRYENENEKFDNYTVNGGVQPLPDRTFSLGRKCPAASVGGRSNRPRRGDRRECAA
ncbi:MAG: hypothetical protein BBJ57_03860 [Desulfobacterales bacterium PC51MH44]|nr:MAG: hypothetical protein BBJ57_03860 [Desulfobacterales bacterium PC51MH44]